MIINVVEYNEPDSTVADKSKAIGHVINPGPVTTKTRIFKWKYDCFNHCRLVLCNVLGSAMWLRYPKHLIVLTNGEAL